MVCSRCPLWSEGHLRKRMRATPNRHPIDAWAEGRMERAEGVGLARGNRFLCEPQGSDERDGDEAGKVEKRGLSGSRQG